MATAPSLLFGARKTLSKVRSGVGNKNWTSRDRAAGCTGMQRCRRTVGTYETTQMNTTTTMTTRKNRTGRTLLGKKQCVLGER